MINANLHNPPLQNSLTTPNQQPPHSVESPDDTRIPYRRWFRLAFLTFLIPLLSCSLELSVDLPNPVAGQQVVDTPDTEPPSFYVRRADNRKVETFNWPQDPPYQIDNATIKATLEYRGENQWRLTATPKIRIAELAFPSGIKSAKLDQSNLHDDVIYYPYWLGVIRRADSMKPWGWWGLDYPGSCFSPLIVREDENAAFMLAAIDWPPKRVRPMFCGNGTLILYPIPPAPGQTKTYDTLIAVATKAETNDRPLWAAVVDPYKRWLKQQIERENLQPNLPDWIRYAHGWLNIQLENRRSFDAMRELAFYKHWSQFFPWVQFWGQMSNYAGPKHLARPPLQLDEETGCCLEESTLHPRYRADLPRMSAAIRRAGGHVGYYERPAKNANLESAAGRQYVENWIAKNRTTHNADAHYVDVLGASYFGNALTIAQWIRDSLPESLVIEGPVDIYPAAFLISGSLTAGNWGGGPDAVAKVRSGSREMSSCVRFGRYVLDDRVMFLGQSNGDGKLWGPKNQYWTERQVFLLGAKFDPTNPSEIPTQPIGRTNQALEMIIAEWERTDWHRQEPIYQDQIGLAEIPPGIDARRFQTKDGRTLLAIENWRQQSGLKLLVDRKTVAIPNRKIAVVPVPSTHGQR